LKPKEKITNPIAVLRKSNNWDAFKSHLDVLSGKEKLKGDCFEELTEHYLKLLIFFIKRKGGFLGAISWDQAILLDTRESICLLMRQKTLRDP
jgi:hypothetical protein